MKKHLAILIPLFFMISCSEEDHHIDIQYSGEQLRYIACPLGGIGTGNMLIDAYGSIGEFEVFNRPAMDESPPDMTFFALFARAEGCDSVLRIMEGERLSEFPNPFGRPRQQLGGLPRFREAIFHNAYPLVSVELIDEQVPLDINMHAWSPFIPLDAANSSLATVVIEWELYNPGKKPVDYSLAFSMANPIKGIEEYSSARKGQFTSMPVHLYNWHGIEFSSPQSDSLKPNAGQVRVMFPDEGVLLSPLPNGQWWDDAHFFWNDFSLDGKLETRADVYATDEHNTGPGAMYLSGKLDAGERRVIPFIFTWYIPYRKLEASMALGNSKVAEKEMRNYYTLRFRGNEEQTAYILENLDMLRTKTKLFSEAMTTSSVPKQVLDAAISNMAALKTNLLMQDENGNVHGFEGLGNDFGCCPGNCTHVWNYAQTMAALFPALEQNVRATGFGVSTHASGYQNFRTVFPLGDQWFKNVAADGQMGNIMRVYREWKISGNNTWLGALWPDVKSALEFAWKGAGTDVQKYPWTSRYLIPWDPYKEGVLRGEQHNTYDINFFGPNMMTGSLYLGALKACSEMAMAMNEPQSSREYYDLYLKGRQRYQDLLWNGEYYIQESELPEGIDIPLELADPNNLRQAKYQFGNGCLSDQLLGQYLAFVSGLGYIMDTVSTVKALESIYKYNFREEMRNFDNVQRIYAANDESGLVLCTWPKDDKPELPFVYADEVWSGVEYQVAASMIYAGLLEEGLRITEGVRERYNGSNRNPFAEIESGRYYARSMASWGVYQAMAGYAYDGLQKTMSFSPAEDVLPIRYFWSGSKGWGSIEVSRAKIELSCLHGSLELNSLELRGRSFFVFREFQANSPSEVSYENESLNISFPDVLILSEGETFRMDIP